MIPLDFPHRRTSFGAVVGNLVPLKPLSFSSRVFGLTQNMGTRFPIFSVGSENMRRQVPIFCKADLWITLGWL